jgi:hypothetical protein
MQSPKISPVLMFVSVSMFILSACNTPAAQPVSTSTPKLTATITVIPTVTPRPSFTPRPTRTPDLTATQHAKELSAESQAYFDKWNAETQKYYDLGYLTSTDGINRKFADFTEEWAQLRWYRSWVNEDQAKDFYVSAHFKWASAYRNADPSGCGIVFAVQKNSDKYSVFLDRNGILFYIFEESYGYYRPVGITRGTGLVKFGNPFDKPVEADFALVVSDAYARVLVNGELIGEYTLSENKLVQGGFGPAILSGTNKDFGTRCEITDFRTWVAN